MGEKINNLETDAMTLYRDSSKEALKLEGELKKKGYELRIVFSGARPTLNGPGCFLSGYEEIRKRMHLD